MEKEKLLNKINNMIELLEKHERFDESEYKVRRLKSELVSEKYRYSEETIRASIEERYIKPTNLDGKRVKLLKQLQEP